MSIENRTVQPFITINKNNEQSIIEIDFSDIVAIRQVAPLVHFRKEYKFPFTVLTFKDGSFICVVGKVLDIYNMCVNYGFDVVCFNPEEDR